MPHHLRLDPGHLAGDCVQHTPLSGQAACAVCLAMFHHDPDRKDTDTEIDFIQMENDNFFHGKRAPAKSLCAGEQMRIRLPPQQHGATLLEVD